MIGWSLCFGLVLQHSIEKHFNKDRPVLRVDFYNPKMAIFCSGIRKKGSSMHKSEVPARPWSNGLIIFTKVHRSLDNWSNNIVVVTLYVRVNIFPTVLVEFMRQCCFGRRMILFVTCSATKMVSSACRSR